MAEYKSDVKKIYYPVERVYERLSDLNNLTVIQQNLDNPMIREKMLEQAKAKLQAYEIEYVLEKSTDIRFEDEFEVVTAIQSHHYMHEEERELAVKNVYRALKKGGIFICFENVVPDDPAVKQQELLRWGRYQQRRGKTAEEALAHNARCGVNYFPLTVPQHIDLLKKTGFSAVHVFWISYMQMGIYAIK